VADDENRGAASGGWTAPEPPVVHRAFLTAYGDYTNPGAGMMALGWPAGTSGPTRIRTRSGDADRSR
jgi:hypothetical protein